MRLCVLYRPDSEHGRLVEEFMQEFQRREISRSQKLEIVNIDSKDGTATASLYDVVSYPAILALTDDGQLLKSWQGDNLPLMNELAYYTQG